jgi:hypothetical protein
LYLRVLQEVDARAGGTGENIHAVPIFMMFDFAEAIDGVCLLVERGSAKNCPQLLRTAMEVQLGLRYVLETKADYRRRCLAYEYFHLWEDLKWYQKCDPDHPLGRQLRGELKGQELSGVFDRGELDLKSEISRREKRMGSDRYSEVRAEIARAKRDKNKVTEWYSLWNGPKSANRLAKQYLISALSPSGNPSGCLTPRTRLTGAVLG